MCSNEASSVLEDMEKKYRSIENVWFEGEDMGSQYMLTKTRYIIEVCSSKVASVLEEIYHLDGADKVWKGITVGSYFGTDVQLWAESVSGTSGRYRITSIKLLTDLNWQKDYKALFNVRLEREVKDPPAEDLDYY